MSTIEQLGAGIGNKVKFSAEEHVPFGDKRPREEIPLVDVEAEIVGLGDNAIYVHPWTNKLAAWTRIQNMRTGEISAVKAIMVDGKPQPLPLKEHERYVLGVNKFADIFSLA